MIKGIGVDVVDVNRFMATLSRVPDLRERRFTPAQPDHPPAAVAARCAVKQAAAKGLGAPGCMRWHDGEIRRDTHTPPHIHTTGTVLAVARSRGIRTWHVSISHDGGIATAFVIGEG